MLRKTLFLGVIFTLSSILLVLGLWIFPYTSRAANLCVAPGGAGGCYATIQSAINAASDGDTIRVAQGTYQEAITVTKSVNLEGGWNSDFSVQNWDTYVSTIDAQRTASVIQIHGQITVTIKGFTITGGDGSDYLGWGGGIEVYGDVVHGNANVIISHNIITNNIACTHNSCQGEGGGIHVGIATATIEYNTIISNSARTSVSIHSGQGGGVKSGYRSETTLIGNTIMSNTAAYSSTGLARGEGGGVYGYSNSIEMRDNIIAYNVAAIHGPGYGGGAYIGGSLYDNQIHDNTASIDGEGYGGGVYAEYAPDIEGNTISNNYASRAVGGGDGYGGGVYMQYARLSNNTIENNGARQGGGVYLNEYSHTEMHGNTISGNRAMGSVCSSGMDMDGGGGILSKNRDAKITGNTISNNTSACMGGGIFITADGESELTGNIIDNNTAQVGGGLAVYTTTVNAEGNRIDDNIAFVWGGGVYLVGVADVTLNRNLIADNAADGFFGLAAAGIFVGIEHDIPVTITNNIIARNTAVASNNVAGVYCGNGACRVLNNTFVDNNSGAHKEALYLANPSPSTSTHAHEVWNNLFVGHSTAVEINSGAAFVVNNGFWDNITDISGGSDPHPTHAAPFFVDRAGGDYHLTALSPMIDAASDSTSPAVDYDNDPRPMGAHADIGADEYALHNYLPLIIKAPPSGGGCG